jgi:transposase-like protein
MKAMARHRSHGIEFKRQVAQEFIVGETLLGLAGRHGVSRNLIRVWVMKFEAGAFDKMPKRPVCFRNTRRRSPPSSAWWAGRRSKSSF